MGWGISDGDTVNEAYLNDLIEAALGDGEPLQPAEYILYLSGSTYKARNGVDGTIDYSGTNGTTVLQATLDAMTGGKIHILDGSYSLGQVQIPDAMKNIGVTIEGSARYRPVITHSGTDEALFTVETGANNYYYVNFRNLRLVAGANTGAYPLIDFSSVYRGTVDNCSLVGNAKANYGVKCGKPRTTIIKSYLNSLAKGVYVVSGGNATTCTVTYCVDCTVAYDIAGDTFRGFAADAEATDTTAYAIQATGHAAHLYGCRIEGDVGTATGVSIAAGAERFLMVGGSMANLATKVSDSGTNSKFRSIYGYITEKLLTTQTVNIAETTLAHGLATTPNLVQPYSLGNYAPAYHSKAPDATNIYLKADDDGRTFDIYVAKV